MAFTYREGLDRPLTYQEMDDNLEYVEALAQNSEAMSDSAGASAAQAATSAGLAADQVALATDQAQLAEGHEEQAQIYAAAAQSAAGVPSLAGNAGKVLGVASGEQGVEWKQLGTAATRDVTTSSTDTTVGRLLANGSHGLGSQSAPGLTGDSLDSSRVAGFYAAGTSSTTPFPETANIIHLAGYANYQAQIGVGLAGAVPTMYLRTRVFTAWRPVVTMLSTGNTIPDNNGILHNGTSIPAGKQSVTEDTWYLGTDKQHTANATGAVTLDLASASIFDLTLTGNTTLTVSNASVPSGETRSVVVRIRQGATARTLTWWSGITWLASTTPEAPEANGIKEYVLSYDGSSWLGREGASN